MLCRSSDDLDRRARSKERRQPDHVAARHGNAAFRRLVAGAGEVQEEAVRVPDAGDGVHLLAGEIPDAAPLQTFGHDRTFMRCRQPSAVSPQRSAATRRPSAASRTDRACNLYPTGIQAGVGAGSYQEVQNATRHRVIADPGRPRDRTTSRAP